MNATHRHTLGSGLMFSVRASLWGRIKNEAFGQGLSSAIELEVDDQWKYMPEVFRSLHGEVLQDNDLSFQDWTLLSHQDQDHLARAIAPITSNLLSTALFTVSAETAAIGWCEPDTGTGKLFTLTDLNQNPSLQRSLELTASEVTPAATPDWGLITLHQQLANSQVDLDRDFREALAEFGMISGTDAPSKQRF